MTSKSKRGFASMDPDRQRQIASKGGRAAHEKGTAHEWSRDEARNAGRKGGEMVSRDRAPFCYVFIVNLLEFSPSHRRARDAARDS